MGLRAATLAVLFVVGAPVVGWTAGPRVPGPGDRCPVCGMFVSKTPSWVASVTFRNGEAYFFDGPKDLFRYKFGLAKYAKGKTAADIEALHVTEYYSARPVKAETALYALGSDVLGPMGAELVPIVGKSQAEAFARDHKAKRILSYAEVTPKILETLE